MFTLNRRLALASLGAAAVLSLTACASLNSVSADAQSFGSWPAARQAGTFAFERLPSQQRDAAGQATLEDATRGALLKAGFKLEVTRRLQLGPMFPAFVGKARR